MKYNVTLVDPANYKFAHVLTDLCRTIAYGLRELGLDCDLTVNSIDSGSMNIIVGTHLLNGGDVANVIGSGAQYIPLQSEVLTRDPKTGAVISSYQGAQFEEVARPLMDHAVAVWDGLTELRVLHQLSVGDEKVKRFKIGYCEGLEHDVEHRPYDRKDLDVMFFGSLTPHRQKIFARFNGVRTAVFGFGPSAFRNDMIARAKINLSLHSSPELDYFPQPRTGYLLNNRAFVLAETSIDHPGMRDLVDEAPADMMGKRCAELLGDPAALQARAEAAYEGYRRMRMADMLAEIL
jgi:hypothetical protein